MPKIFFYIIFIIIFNSCTDDSDPLLNTCIGVYDNCGVCDGDDPCNQCGFSENIYLSTIEETVCFPHRFIFQNSAVQAAYYFTNVILEKDNLNNNILISNDDWVGVFYNDICIGARKWNFENQDNASIIVWGADASQPDYIVSDNLPSFQIYDASENLYYRALPSEENNWVVNGTFFHTELNAVEILP